MGFMGVVHGDHIGDQAGVADKTGEIGHCRQTTRGLDQERSVGDIAEPDGIDRQRIGEGGLVQVGDARGVLGKGDAMAGNTLGQGHSGGKEKDQQ